MILGRFLGVLLSSSLVLLWSSEILKSSWLIGFGTVALLSVLGTATGMGISMIVGPMIKQGPVPLQQDQLSYWTDKYGEEEGKDAYRIWLNEV